MIVIRWAATLTFLLCLVLFANGARNWALVLFAVAVFVVAGWAWGAPWSERIDETHPDALGSLDIRERTQTTAGGTPSPVDTRPPDA